MYWDTRIDEARVESRLGKLRFPQLVFYLVGCATHAKDVVAASQAKNLSYPFFAVASLFDRFWTDWPQSLRPSTIKALYDETTSLLLNFGESLPAGDDVLVWAASYAFSVAKLRKYNEKCRIRAMNALDRAYVFVYTFHHEQNQIYASEDEIRTVEMNSPACNAEIEFQLAFLTTVEAIQGQPLPYAAIVSQMGGGH